MTAPGALGGASMGGPSLASLDTPELAAFRREVRAWAEANSPGDWRARVADGAQDYEELAKQCRTALRKAGYLAPHWPREFGGGGFSAPEQIVLKQELARAQFPPVQGGIGMHHAAATIIMHGTSEQQTRLEAILDGEIWCQGFSEPNAGSDLASLQTRALRDGDDYVVTGQKIWSSGAHRARWCLLLARTDPDAPKHRGLSVFMVDMKSRGIEVRPIREATGGTAFCEIFFNDVRVPARHRIGPENEGWAISQTTLSTERGSMTLDNHARLAAMVDALCVEAAQTPLESGRVAAEHDGIRQELAERVGEVEVLGMLAESVISQLVRHGQMGPEGSILKLFYSETLQKLTGLGARVRGIAANVAEEAPPDVGGTRGWLTEHIGSWTWTIAAGSNEIQRNIIAERILGLPRDPLTREAPRRKAAR